MRFKSLAIPAGEELARRIFCQIQIIPSEHGIAAFNIAKIMHHGLGHGFVASGADVPLQIADPEHELGQRGGAFVELNA